jgi:APA family basic amino acid/polyamine antiporter
VLDPSRTGTLQKRLGFAFALAVSAGSVIGSGIMRTPGVVIDQVPVVWLVLGLWLAGGVHALLSANIASELTAAMPQAGGTYVPVRAAFGESMGALAGWVMWLSYTGSVAALSIACANFVGTVSAPVAAHTQATAVVFALAVFALNWIGVRQGSLVQTAGSAVKVLLLCGVIAVAFFGGPASAPSSLSAVAAVPAKVGPSLGFFAVVTSYQMIYGAYGGWFGPIFFAEEDRKAITNIPRALALSVVTVTAVYLALNVSLLRALDLETMRHSDLPIALVIERVFGRGGSIVIALLATVSVLVTLNSLVMIAPRVLFGLARDGLFLRVATRVNRGGSPDIAMGIGALVALPLIFSGGFVFVFRITGALTVFAFCLYEASLFKLRSSRPDLPRPFRAIGYPVLPALALAVDCALLIAFLTADPVSGMYMAGLVAIGIPVGLVLHRHRRAMSGEKAR